MGPCVPVVPACRCWRVPGPPGPPHQHAAGGGFHRGLGQAAASRGPRSMPTNPRIRHGTRSPPPLPFRVVEPELGRTQGASERPPLSRPGHRSPRTAARGHFSLYSSRRKSSSEIPAWRRILRTEFRPRLSWKATMRNSRRSTWTSFRWLPRWLSTRQPKRAIARRKRRPSISPGNPGIYTVTVTTFARTRRGGRDERRDVEGPSDSSRNIAIAPRASSSPVRSDLASTTMEGMPGTVAV